MTRYYQLANYGGAGVNFNEPVGTVEIHNHLYVKGVREDVDGNDEKVGKLDSLKNGLNKLKVVEKIMLSVGII